MIKSAKFSSIYKYPRSLFDPTPQFQRLAIRFNNDLASFESKIKENDKEIIDIAV